MARTRRLSLTTHALLASAAIDEMPKSTFFVDDVHTYLTSWWRTATSANGSAKGASNKDRDLFLVMAAMVAGEVIYKRSQI